MASPDPVRVEWYDGKKGYFVIAEKRSDTDEEWEFSNQEPGEICWYHLKSTPELIKTAVRLLAAQHANPPKLQTLSTRLLQAAQQADPPKLQAPAISPASHTTHVPGTCYETPVYPYPIRLLRLQNRIPRAHCRPLTTEPKKHH